MITQIKCVERRRHERSPVRDDSFVFLMFYPDLSVMSGKIADVSLGGLGFTYLAPERRTGDFVRLQMLCMSCDYNSIVIFAKTISDFEKFRTVVDGERRSGVEFERLTQEQQHDLETFIKCCTLGSA